MPRFREEVVNVQLAEALVARGLDAQPETITRRRKLPDVIINLGGLKVVLEGRTESLFKNLLEDAAARITDGVADISIAVAYPERLKTARNLAALRQKIESATYSGSALAFAGGTILENGFEGKTLTELADLINTCFRLVVQNDVVREQVQQVESMIEGIVETAVESDLFFASDVLADRLRTALGIEPARESDGETTTEESD